MLSGFLALFRGKPMHAIGDDGRMALSDHFRELRARLMRATAALLVGIVVALVFYHQLFELVVQPYRDAKQALGQKVETTLTVSGVGGPLVVQLKLCAMVAVVGTSPVWLYQIWAFILPGLHPKERKWSRLFVAVAGPLFIAGAALGYYIMPKGIEVLVGFTQKGTTNLVDFNEFLTFMTQMLLVFGLAFEIPLFVVLLNLMGMLPGKALARYRPWIIIGTFVFAAVATPSTDPFSMCFLAAPMLILFGLSEVIARTVDRTRARNADETPVDEASKL